MFVVFLSPRSTCAPKEPIKNFKGLSENLSNDFDSNILKKLIMFESSLLQTLF